MHAYPRCAAICDRGVLNEQVTSCTRHVDEDTVTAAWPRGIHAINGAVLYVEFSIADEINTIKPVPSTVDGDVADINNISSVRRIDDNAVD